VCIVFVSWFGACSADLLENCSLVVGPGTEQGREGRLARRTCGAGLELAACVVAPVTVSRVEHRVLTNLTDPAPFEPAVAPIPVPPRRDGLRVVAFARWVASDLAAGADRWQVPVFQSLGVDPDTFPDGDWAMWSPTEHAARVIDAGVRFVAQTPGPLWPLWLPEQATRRQFWAGSYAEASAGGDVPDVGWWKLAEMKRDTVPAGWRSRAEMMQLLEQAAAPAGTMLLCSGDRFEFREEHRVVVIGGVPVAASPYLVDGDTWEPDWVDRTDVDRMSAFAYATEVCASVSAEQQPSAWVLDVGCDRSVGWVTVEPNPVWSCGRYGVDPAAMAAAVLTATSSVVTGGERWVWEPDPWLCQLAARRRPLIS
jgi:hypothetical protein